MCYVLLGEVISFHRIKREESLHCLAITRCHLVIVENYFDERQPTNSAGKDHGAFASPA